jgi:hypothetical protein
MRTPIRFVAIVVAVSAALAVMPTARADPRHAPEVSIETLVSRLRTALAGSDTAVRLYYRTSSCADLVRQLDPLSLRLQPPRRSDSPLDSVRRMFGDDPRVRVTEGPPGIVRITIDDPPVALLETRIEALELGDPERFSPELAIVALEGSPDLAAGIARTGMEQPFKYINILFPGPAPYLPHLPAAIADVTADAFLDNVATTFDGLVSYAVCPDSREFRLRFIGMEAE